MIHSQNVKTNNVIVPQAVTTTAVTGAFDTLGYDYMTVEFLLDTAATTVSATTMKLSEGDTTSSYTDITAFTGGTTDGNFTLPTADGTSGTGTVVKFHVDLTKRKRYMKVSLANSASRLSAVKVDFERGKEIPTSDSGRGADEVVYG